MEKLSKASIVPAASEPAEKRRHPRFPFSTGGEAFDPQANVRVTGRLSDISRSGCYMDTISPFAVNAAIILTVTRKWANRVHIAAAAANVRQPARYSNIGLRIKCFAAGRERETRMAALLGRLAGGRHNTCF